MKPRYIEDESKHILLYQGLLRLIGLRSNGSYTCIVYNNQCSNSTKAINVIVIDDTNDINDGGHNNNSLSTHKSSSYSGSTDIFVLFMVSATFAFVLLVIGVVVWHSFRTRPV